MKNVLLFSLMLFSILVNAQEGTKQLMPNANDQLWLEFQTFAGNNFGMYGCDSTQRINIYLNAGEKMYFGMKLKGSYGGNTVITNPNRIYFQVSSPSDAIAFSERNLPSSGTGYISDYTEAVTGPNGVSINGTTISGGYTPFSFTASETGNYYIEFRETAGANRFALEYFDVTVTDGSDNVITNPGEPNKSAGRLWSYGWSLTNASFTDFPVNAFFYVYTSDEFINRVNFKMYPYSFVFAINSYGVTTYTDETNFVKRAQSLEGDQTNGKGEYKVFLNDPDRSVWYNTTIAPPHVQVWSEDTLFLDYNYNRDPLYLPLDHDVVVMEKNMPSCPYDDIAIFKIETNVAGYTAILIDVDKDGVYSTEGSDRVIYRDMKKGLNYVIWNFLTDRNDTVYEGSYNASATFLGRGPTHFPLYDVEQMDDIVTSSIRPYKKLETTIYWDDSQITDWGDQDGGDLMDATEQIQLDFDTEIPRIWSWHGTDEGRHNGNENTLNTWFNALDLGYHSIGLVVSESESKCINGLAPWVGDIYKEGEKNQNLEFDTIDFQYKFFEPFDDNIDSIRILSLPSAAAGVLKLNAADVTVNQKIHFDDLNNLSFVPTSDWTGKESFLWEAKSSSLWSSNQELIYLIINTPPTITEIADQNLCTNTPTAPISFTIGDAETDPADLIVTGFSADPTFVPNSNVVIEGSGANRTVTVTPADYASGDAIIYVMVEDEYTQVIEEFTVYVGPDLQFSGDTTVCGNQDLYLIAQENGADSISWNFNGTEVSDEKVLFQDAGFVDVGLWSLTVKKDGCISTRYFNVDVAPLTTFTGDPNVCTGEQIYLTATVANATYSWRKGGVEIATGRNLDITSASLLNDGIDYTLFVDKDGCQNESDEFEISVINPPNTALTVTGDTIDPWHDGTILINNAQTDVDYIIYQDDNPIDTISGPGNPLSITVLESYLSLGDNLFTIGADNGNCEFLLEDTALIYVSTPDITVNINDAITSEDAETAVFTVVLNTEPLDEVTIPVSSNDIGEGTIGITELIFTTANWDEPQTVTITGVDDDIIDGDQPYSVMLGVASCANINSFYHGMDADDILLTNEDKDTAAVIVNPTSGLITSEDGITTDDFNIRLSCEPSADVIIELSSSNSSEGDATVAFITLNSANWLTGVNVTVEGADDDIDDDDQGYTILTSLSESTDGNFDKLPVANVSVTNIDDDSYGINVSPTSGLTTTESSGTATFTIVLNSEPTGNVTIDLASNDPGEGTVSPSTVTFTSGNWGMPVLFTVTGQDDQVEDGDIQYDIVTDAALSPGDSNYDGLNASDVNITNTDNDNAGIWISQLANITTDEDGGYTDLSIHLQSQPLSTIVLEITSDDASEGTVSVGTLSFTTSNWITNQQVRINGEDDDFIDGNVNYNITVSVFSGDTTYVKESDIIISAQNADNDVATVNLSTTTVSTTEGGGTGSVSFTLNSQPSHDVTLTFAGVDATEGSISVGSITFTSGNWNVPQVVTFTGEDDEIQDGPITYIVTTTASSSDGNYNGLAVSDISVTNSDNDVAGITISPITNNTTEAAGDDHTATFTIELNTQPTNDVTINTIESSDIGEGTVSPSTITFTPSEWGTKLITVTGVDEDIDDGDQPYYISISNTSSSDGNYHDKSFSDINLSNIDDDIRGLTVSGISNNTTEAAGDDHTATFTIVLNSQPTAGVTVDFTSSDISEGEHPASVNFTTANWDQPQIVTVTGIDDSLDDDDQPYTISSLANGGDYVNVNANDVSITNIDDDDVGVTVSGINHNTTEAAGVNHTATFTIVLDCQPTADVTIGLSSSNSSEGTIAPVINVEFTAANWSTPQTITVTGVDDAVDDGDITYSIITASALGGNYAGYDPADVSITNIDDDTRGLSVTSISNNTTEAAGANHTATFDVVLTSQPTAGVTVAFTSSDISEGEHPASVSFTTVDWNTPKEVTVTGVDDSLDDNDQPYTISTLANGGDYVNVSASDVAITNIDDDEVGVTVSTISNNTTEAAGDDHTATFTIVLDSEPTANVNIGLSTSDSTEGIIEPVTGVEFTTLNWDQPQTITVTGVDESVDDGDVGYSIITAAAQGGDYEGFNPDDVSITNIDDDDAGITVDPYNVLYTNESGTTIQFNMCLNSEPTANVIVDLLTNDPTEGIADKASIEFTPSNWMTNQLVTVTGQDDDVDDGDIPYKINTTTRVSADLLYSEIEVHDVSITNQDNDAWGFTVNPESLTINENGSDESFTIVLKSRPTGNVSIGISSENENKATVLPASINFLTTGDDWKTPKQVTVSPVDNFIDDGNTDFNIVTGTIVSTDVNYSGKTPADVAVTSIDDDDAEIIVSSISGNTSEDGTTAEFTIVLNSEPTDDVTIGISSSNTAEGTVSDASVIFNSVNWSTPVKITVTGAQDAIADGNQTYYILFATSVSSDDNYDGIDLTPIEVVNADDDSPGVTVFPLSGLETTEAGGTASFKVRLNSQPTNDVTINLNSNNESEGIISASQLTFTTVDWNVEQTITITGQDDIDNDGDILYHIITSDPSSSDVGYDTISYVPNVSVTNIDDTTPRLENDSEITDEDTDVTIDVLLNDKGLDDGGLNLTISGQPSYGNVTIEADNKITYSPNGLFNGDDSFTYTVCDTEGDCDDADVTVKVNWADDFPIANFDERGTSMNTDVTVDVLFNDEGMEDGGILVSIDEAPAQGNADVNPDQTITYTPAADYIGLVSFIYEITDVDGDSDTAYVQIDVKEINYIPDANNDEVQTFINTSVDISVLTNDIGLEDGFDTLRIYTNPKNGNAWINTNRTITYDPNPDYTGRDSLIYLLQDVDGDYDTAWVKIDILPVSNAQPVALNDSVATEYETPRTINVLLNDTGLEDGVLSLVIHVDPLNGTCNVNADFTVTYTPNPGYSGMESFGYQVCDMNGDCATATVKVLVKEEGVTNYIPVANPDAAITEENTPVDINILSNDTGLEDGFGSLTIHTAPTNGDVVIHSDHTVTYTPSPWFADGEDSFIYLLKDSEGDSDTALVTISVVEDINYLPEANDDAVATEYETPRIIQVLLNDEGLEDGGLMVEIETGSANGTAVVNGDNSITFTPAEGYSGTTSFEYQVTDVDGDDDIATVTVFVKEEGVTNYIPVANPDAAITEENTPVDINVLSNDTGLEDGFGSLTIHTAPTNGDVVIHSDHTVTYTPSPWFADGEDSFIYLLKDSEGDSDTALVTISVVEDINYLPEANDDAVATEYETPRIIQVLLNDEGLEDGGLTVEIETGSANGTAVVNGNNSITFTPAEGYSGTTSFEYRVTDVDGDDDIATVTVLVKEEGVTNYIPVANPDAATTEENTPVDINVLSNDTGLEDGFGSLTIHTPPVNGSVIINSDNTVTYTPSLWFADGDDQFIYLLKDSEGDSDTALVKINVLGDINYQPEANNDAVATEYEIARTFNVLLNDMGLEDGGLMVEIETGSANGTAVVNGDNSITFTPAEGYSGTTSFEYRVTDVDGDDDIATVTVLVKEEGVTNYIPVANSDAAITEENTPVDINVLSNDTGLEDGFGSLTIHTAPTNGDVVIHSDHTVTYTPSPWFADGEDSFIYLLKDSEGDSDTALVSISVVEDINYLPEANDDAVATEYETPRIIQVLLNDEGLEDGGLTVEIETGSANGTAVVNGDNSITFTPAEGYSGTTSFEYRVTDVDGDDDIATVTVLVKEEGVTNYIPVANPDAAITEENTPVDINVLSNDTGLEDGFGSLTIHTAPTNGDVVIHSDHTVTYTPSPWFADGEDSFIYLLKDSEGDSDTALVTISVVEDINYQPKANDDAVATEYETPRIIQVLLNDEGLEDGGLTVEIETGSANGTAVVNGNNSITFTPAEGYSGTTSFEYRVTDVDGDDDIATVTVLVKEEGVTNYIPVANPDAAITEENTPVDINVLSNDTGLEDGFGSLTIHTAPVNGSVVINEDRTITYTPSPWFADGEDSFIYLLKDSEGDSDTALVTISVVEDIDYQPIANDDAVATEYETARTIDVLLNDTGKEDGGIVVSIESGSANGTAVVNGDNNITFTPAEGYSGTTSFEYRVTDVDGDDDIATVTVLVKEEGVTNYIPVANPDAATTEENTPVDIHVLSNDTGLEDGFGSLTIHTPPVNGSVIINEDRTITYTPSPWYSDGVDHFIYLLKDSEGDQDTALVTITVLSEINYIPVAVDDARGTSMNTAVKIEVLDNDTGLENGGLVLTVVSNPSNGTYSINEDNTITYTPDNNYIGTDNYEYQICDIDGDCATANVTITVREENSVPVAVDDKVYTGVNDEVTIDVLGNDSGLDDGGIIVSINSEGIFGSSVVNSDNTITYTPEPGFEGVDHFTYQVADADGDFDLADVEVNVMSGALPGIIISAVSGNTQEYGTEATFNLVLGTEPTQDVIINLNSDDLSEGILSETSLTFSASNWDTEQTVTITGQDDDVDDGDIAYNIIIDNAESDDVIYDGLTINNIALINMDDDEAGVTVIADSTQTSEDGTEISFKVVLNSEPLHNVSIDIESDNLDEGIIDKLNIEFTPENWSDTVDVIVTGQDDEEIDGDVTYTIVLSAAVSTDPNYNGIDPNDITLVNIDNDSRELIIPEAFSPGNDGFNDFFEVVNVQHYDRASIKVYNRWGSLVYSSDNYQNDWDGKGNVGSSVGSDLPMGTYFYVLEIKDTGAKYDGSVFIKR